MFGTNQFHQELHVTTYHPPANAVSPLMLVCGPYPKTNDVCPGYSNQGAVAVSPVVYPNSYPYPVANLALPSAVGPVEEVVDPRFEVYDNFLKAPIAVRPDVVFPSKGSYELFDTAHQKAGVGHRNSVRICDAFQSGSCALADTCNDIHVAPEYLKITRNSRIAWLQSKEEEFKKTLCDEPHKVFRVFCADMKEMVEVPIVALQFTKGLYVDSSTRARRARGGHHSQFAMTQQGPTACGLFANDPSQCKWGKWCNQVHIEAEWMKKKKDDFFYWSNLLLRRFNGMSSTETFSVHDPQLKMSLELPKASIAAFTRGLFQRTATKLPSVCMLYQRNRCTADKCCNQIHVIPQYLHIHRRLISYGDRLSVEERRDLENQKRFLLESMLKPTRRDSFVVDDTSAQMRELNPQAQPYLPSPPPEDVENTFGHAKRREGTRQNVNDVERGECRVVCPRFSSQREHTCVDGAVLSDLSMPYTSMRVTECKSACPRQQEDHPMKSMSITEVRNNNCRPRKNTSPVDVSPLPRFCAPPDGDDRSQSSLQASQTNLSCVDRGSKPIHNSYTFGASGSCNVMPRFGCIQPVRSAGNSCTTAAASCLGVDGAGFSSTGGWGLRSQADSTGTNDTPAAAHGAAQQEPEAGANLPSFFSMRW